MSETYDIAIIGLGPAGATLARLLAPHFRIFALDGQPLMHEKPCGGLLAPDAQKALARLQLTLPKEILVSPQIFAVKTFDVPKKLVRYYPRSYINLDRHRFDRWLVSLIPPSVHTQSGVCRSIVQEKDGYRIAYKRADGTMMEVHADRVVGADGASSFTRRAFFPGRKLNSFVAIQQWFKQSDGNPFYSCVFDGTIPGLCSWSVSKDGDFLFGGAYKAKNCRQSFEKQKQALASCGFEFGPPLKTESCLVLRPRLRDGFCLGRDGVFLLGEAAGFISPSSLEGISWALNSAVLLAGALTGSKDPQSAYRKATRGLRFKLFLKMLKCPFLYRPRLRSLVMKSGMRAITLCEQDTLVKQSALPM
jgi:flavin-dependent dehydrogenase